MCCLLTAAHLATVGGGEDGRGRLHGLPQEGALPPAHQESLLVAQREYHTNIFLLVPSRVMSKQYKHLLEVITNLLFVMK